MDVYILDLLVIGTLLLVITLGSNLIARLPLSYALIYLGLGIVLGPHGFHLIQLKPDAEFLERLTEFVVIISLYSCGLKMNRQISFWAWQSTARLIGLLMPISIFAIAALGHWFLKLEWGIAILLGAILAPTDPVLASEVQLTHAEDHDELRFGLTSEGGLNDALAFPFVYFGLHWIKDSDWQSWFGQWAVVDLLWAIAAGIGMGVIVGRAITWMDEWVQQRHNINEAMEDFTALSTILLTYGLTELVNGYGFLAVFVAGITVQRRYRQRDPEKQNSQLHFTERIEKLLEVGTILLLGAILQAEPALKFADEALLIGGSLIFLIRPIGAWISTIGRPYHPRTRWLLGWFGIRGVGSLYYLTYAFGQGLRGETGELIAWISYLTVAFSVIVHGVTATPLMRWYEKRVKTMPIPEEIPSSSEV